MKRSKSFRLPKLRYHRASKQGVVELAGKQHYLGPHGSPECEAAYNKLIAEWLTNGKKTVTTFKQVEQSNVPVGLSVVEVCEQFLDYAIKYYTHSGTRTAEPRTVR